MQKTKIICFLLLTISMISLFSQETAAFSDPIFQVDQVIKLGESEFLEKIEAKTSDGEEPLGLVLSGGAARAFAHIGVLRELENEGIYPDFIVANSMGSLVGLLYSAGMSLDTIEETISSFPTDFLFTARLPLDGGIIDDSNMISVLHEMFGDLDLKDLEIPIVVIGEDLVTRRQVHFMEGDFYQILSAAIAMPITFPPVRYDGMILMDGGIANLVPVQAAADYTDKIIVSTTFYETENSYRDVLSILNRSIDIGKTRKGINETKNIDNILIRCDVEKFSFMDFAKVDEIVAKGIESTKPIVPQIKEAGFDKNITWTPERIEQLSAKRNDIQEQFDSLATEYNRTNWVTQKDLNVNVLAGFNMYSGPQDDYHLDNSNYGYLSQELKSGPFFGEVREFYDLNNNFGLDSYLNFALFNVASLQNRLSFSWNKDGFNNMYYYGKLDSNIALNSDSYIRPFFAWEGLFVDDFSNLDNSYGRLGLETYTKNYSLTAYAFNENNPVMYGLGLENDFNIKIVGPLYFGQRTVSRFPFDKNNSVSLFKNDGLRGSSNQGVFDWFVVTNNNLSLQFNNLGTLFETLMFNSASISAFCDYYKTDVDGISAGGEFSLEMSLIGLVSFNFTTYAGWDFGSDKLFGSISIGAQSR